MLRGESARSLSLRSLNLVDDNALENIEFKRGATDVVYVRCRELGTLRFIILEVYLIEFYYYKNFRIFFSFSTQVFYLNRVGYVSIS